MSCFKRKNPMINKWNSNTIDYNFINCKITRNYKSYFTVDKNEKFT